MSILSRFKEIIASNLNSLLDKAEDPQKMIEQYLKELTHDLAEVKRETASVMADEAKAKRNLVANQEEIENIRCSPVRPWKPAMKRTPRYSSRRNRAWKKWANPCSRCTMWPPRTARRCARCTTSWSPI